MNKVLALTFLLFLVCHLTMAQNSASGIKAGMNVSSIGGDSENVSMKVGFMGGVFSHLKLSENLKLRPEIVVSNQGANDSENSNTKFSYWYLNIPLIIEYQQDSPFILNFGFQAGTVLNANLKQGDEKQNITSQLENFDLSICGGFGYELSDNFLIEARYNHGLNNTSRNPEFEGDKFPNRVFQLSIAYGLSK